VSTERWQLFPNLTPEEYEALKADIARHGLRVPIVVDASSGLIVDGHHRQRALDELRSGGVKVTDYRDVRAFADDEERLAFVLGANLFRRHLDRAQRNQLVTKLRERGWSLRRIGEVVGVDVATVHRDLSGVAGATPEPRKVVGRDAKTYRARRATPPPSVIVTNRRGEERARQALAKLGDQAPGRLLALKDAERLARQATYRQLRAATTPTGQATGAAWELRSGDFADVLGELDPASVDMVLTDPPYTDDFEERWGDLAEACARVLKPGAVFIAYSGNHNLPQVIDALTAHLLWLWHVVLVQPGQESRIMSAHVHNGHRDLLVLTAGPYHPGRWLRDTLTSKPAAQDKTLHPWQQAAEAPRYLVDLLCPAGGLVVDPCCGAGTFGAVAIGSGRRFLGVDVDPSTLAIAAQRLLHEGDAS
jgi:site-specific DNA-methyltransferase (adenine-specific)